MIVASLGAALALPAGLAVATDSPEPGETPTTQLDRPGYGQRHGWMMGGSGNREDCPFHESADGPQWRQHHDERQQHHDE